tara:strand:+ start:167 stop:1060 length:894 start_codon:yes stop_codon:yes gene_type:complete
MKILLFIVSFFSVCSLKSSPIVNAKWLSQNVCKENIKLIEVGSSYNSYLVEHIKCSQYTNFYKDGWRANKKKVSMSLPEPHFLINKLNKMGVSEGDHIILYPKKNTDIYAMAETTAIYFTFKYLGHKKVSILDGGYPYFKKNFDLFIEEGEFKAETISDYKAKIDLSIIANSNDIIQSKTNNYYLIDSREKDFYLGINKLKGFNEYGTLENSINIPSKWFLKERGLSFNNLNVFKNIYNYSKINFDKNFIFFCYSGLESSINWFVSYELMGNKNSKLYEGSLFDWILTNKPLYKKKL